jgi:hypothetical protein
MAAQVSLMYEICRCRMRLIIRSRCAQRGSRASDVSLIWRLPARECGTPCQAAAHRLHQDQAAVLDPMFFERLV